MKHDFIDIHTHRPSSTAQCPSFEGIHPWTVESAESERLFEQLCERLARQTDGRHNNPGQKPLDLIGETGLDFACDSDRQRQTEMFVRHLELAEKTGMPVVLHTVKSFEPTMELLKGRRLRAVIFHGFTGSLQQAERAVGAGCYLSFGRRSFASPKTVAAMRAIPLSRLFLETDDDDTPIEEIYARATALLGCEPRRLEEQIRTNYEEIFPRNE